MKASKKKTTTAARRSAPEPEIDPRFAPVATAFARDRRVTSGKMMASFGLKVNGKIFAMMVGGKFVAKLPKARVDELVQSGKGTYFDPRKNGRLMRAWVVLDGTRPPWVELAREAIGFVAGECD